MSSGKLPILLRTQSFQDPPSHAGVFLFATSLAFNWVAQRMTHSEPVPHYSYAEAAELGADSGSYTLTVFSNAGGNVAGIRAQFEPGLVPVSAALRWLAEKEKAWQQEGRVIVDQNKGFHFNEYKPVQRTGSWFLFAPVIMN